MLDEDLKNRFHCYNSIGTVQAWPAQPSEVAVCMCYSAGALHSDSKTAYVNSSLNLTASDARALAATLIRAADFADACAIRDAVAA